MKLRFDGRDLTDKFRYSEMRRCRPECICACTGILFFVPLVSVPESRYGREQKGGGQSNCLFLSNVKERLEKNQKNRYT